MYHTVVVGAKFASFVRWLRPRVEGHGLAAETIAVGLLERLWHATINNAKRGDIGRLTDEQIAEAIGWHMDASELVEAMVAVGWLDRHPDHRLLTHDWHDHAPNFVKANEQKMGGFLTKLPKSVPPNGATYEVPPDRSDPRGGTIPNQTKPNETQPNETQPDQIQTRPPDEPPDRSPAARCVRAGKASGKGLDSLEFGEFYDAYPRRVARKNAAKAYAGAVKELVAKGRSPPEAHAFLLAAAREFAAAEICKCEQHHIPFPATWLNSARYDDDRSDWNRRRNRSGRQLGFSGGPGQVYAGPNSLGEV